MSTTIRVHVLRDLRDAELKEVAPNLRNDGLGWYFEIPSGTRAIPEELVPYVREISIFSYMPENPFREAGIYTLGEARGEVEHNLSHQEAGHNIQIRSRNFEEAIELLGKIWAGDIRPEVSHDIDVIQKNFQELVGLRDTVLKELNGPGGYPTLLRVLRDTLGGAWPFCRKSTVLRRVDNVIAGSPPG